MNATIETEDHTEMEELNYKNVIYRQISKAKIPPQVGGR